MAKSNLFFVVLFTLLVASRADWSKILLDISDPKVIEMGQYAVSEYNAHRNGELVFGVVTDAFKMFPVPDGETHYGLFLMAGMHTAECSSQLYAVVVIEKGPESNRTRFLSYFMGRDVHYSA